MLLKLRCHLKAAAVDDGAKELHFTRPNLARLVGEGRECAAGYESVPGQRPEKIPKGLEQRKLELKRVLHAIGEVCALCALEPRALKGVVDSRLVESQKDLILGSEVVVRRPDGEPSPIGHLAHRCLVETLLPEEGEGGFDDGGAGAAGFCGVSFW